MQSTKEPLPQVATMLYRTNKNNSSLMPKEEEPEKENMWPLKLNWTT